MMTDNNKTVYGRWHEPLKKLLRFFINIFVKLEIDGLEKIPAQGPLIVYVNHANWLDPVIAAGIINRKLSVMGKQELFRHRFYGWVLRSFGVFPVKREEGDIGAFRRSLSILRSGQVLILAPEGTRSHTGILQQAKPGIINLALRGGAKIQPMSIIGCLSFPATLKRLRRTPIKLKVGEAYFPGQSGVEYTKEEVQRMTDEAMYKLAALMPPEYRGVYDDATAAATGFMVNRTTNEQ